VREIFQPNLGLNLSTPRTGDGRYSSVKLTGAGVERKCFALAVASNRATPIKKATERKKIGETIIVTGSHVWLKHARGEKGSERIKTRTELPRVESKKSPRFELVAIRGRLKNIWNSRYRGIRPLGQF
jgi:hypothetical protein